MITQACNLSCLGCTNYSDLSHAGFVSWDQGKIWIERWTQRLEIDDFGIMGGEPLINPQVRDWLQGVRSLLPKSQIRFTTNGLLLHKYPDLLDLLQDLGNVVFKITVHIDNPKIENSIKQIMSSKIWTPIKEYGIDRWATDNGLKFQVNRPRNFLKTYRNDYSNMLPYDSKPEEAFAICVQQTCPLLYQGRIYKCSTAGLLKDTLERHHWPNRDSWNRYIDFGIGPDSDDDEIQMFIDNFGRSHALCAQCPDRSVDAVQHLKFVRYKPHA